jgi:hypothetical protein
MRYLTIVVNLREMSRNKLNTKNAPFGAKAVSIFSP